MHKIPASIRAIELPQYNTNTKDAIRSLRVVEKPVPKLKAGQVLIQVAATPCNPSDLLFMRGMYGITKTLPTVPGWECSGTVVSSGGGLLGRILVGKRVACAIQSDNDGTWATHLVADAKSCIPIRKKIGFVQAASLIINPFTAIGLITEAQKKGHKAAIQTAAASQLGRMLIALAEKLNFPLINIVRSEKQERLLRSLNVDLVLISERENFDLSLHELSIKHNTTIAFDAVGGELTGRLLAAMPADASILLYGALAEQACEKINPIDLIFKNKRIEGFWLTRWLADGGLLRALSVSNRAQGLIADGVFKTDVQNHIRLDEVPEKLLQYTKEMTKGKILIEPFRDK